MTFVLVLVCNVCLKKTSTNHNTESLLHSVPVFLKQTLRNKVLLNMAKHTDALIQKNSQSLNTVGA